MQNSVVMVGQKKLNHNITKMILATENIDPSLWLNEDLIKAFNVKIPNKYNEILQENGLEGNDVLQMKEDQISDFIEILQCQSKADILKINSFVHDIKELHSLYDKNQEELENLKSSLKLSTQSQGFASTAANTQFRTSNSNQDQLSQEKQNTLGFSPINVRPQSDNTNSIQSQGEQKQNNVGPVEIAQKVYEEQINSQKATIYESIAVERQPENEMKDELNDKKIGEQKQFQVVIPSLLDDNSEQQIQEQKLLNSSLFNQPVQNGSIDQNDNQSLFKEQFQQGNSSISNINQNGDALYHSKYFTQDSAIINHIIVGDLSNKQLTQQQTTVEGNNDEVDDVDDAEEEVDDVDENDESSEDDYGKNNNKKMRNVDPYNQFSKNPTLQNQNEFTYMGKTLPKVQPNPSNQTIQSLPFPQVDSNPNHIQNEIQQNNPNQDDTKSITNIYGRQFQNDGNIDDGPTKTLLNWQDKIDVQQFNYRIRIMQSKDYQLNYTESKDFTLKYGEKVNQFLINFTRIADTNIGNNYIINNQDCSRNHVQLRCNDNYQFSLENMIGKNGTYIKCRKYEEIQKNMMLQVGNILLIFDDIQIDKILQEVSITLKAFSIAQQDQIQEQSFKLKVGENFEIGRTNSTYFSRLFSTDFQLSREHCLFSFKEVIGKDLASKRLVFFYEEKNPRNGSWIKLTGQQYINNNTIIRIGVQNFVQIQIKAYYNKKLEAHRYQQNMNLNQIQRKIHPQKIEINEDYSYCRHNKGHQHSPNMDKRQICAPCGHVFCTSWEDHISLELYKANNDLYLNQICPQCKEFANTYSIEITE